MGRSRQRWFGDSRLQHLSRHDLRRRVGNTGQWKYSCRPDHRDGDGSRQREDLLLHGEGRELDRGASAASNETWAIPAATVPGAPSKVVATGADASATVTWSAANAGGSNISRYAVTAIDATVASRGGQSCIWTTGTLTCLVLGLTDGDSYSFSVTATNSLGTGPVSAPQLGCPSSYGAVGPGLGRRHSRQHDNRP